MLSEFLHAVTITFTFFGNISGNQNAMLASLPVYWSTNLSTASITITTL
jgi:hypothetical protein